MSEETVMALLDEYTEPNLPPEVLLDPYHPSNDHFFKEKHSLERRIVSQARLLKPQQANAAKSYYAGKTPAQIAKQINRTPTTVRRYINHPDAQRLISLMRHYNQLIDGPNEKHRLHILHRITVDNEKERPSIAISAISEMNRMTGAHHQNDSGGGAGANGPSVTVVVNHPSLAPGPLDRAEIVQDQND